MKFINLHTHHNSSDENIIAVINRYPDADGPLPDHYSIGIHPWHINLEKVTDQLEIIKSHLPDSRCLAIGECGLDKRIEIPLSVQQPLFTEQLKLAESFQKPVIIHCVAAFSEVIAIKKDLNISIPMIIHGFSKNAALAKQLLDHGFYLSFGKYLLRNPELESAFLTVPDNRLFLETDTVTEHISEVYNLAAKYRKISIERMTEVIGENFNTVFGKNKLGMSNFEAN